VETLPLALVQVDRELRAVYANPAVEQMTGFGDLATTRRQDGVEASSRSAEASAWLDLFCDQDRPDVTALLHQALAGQTGRREARLRTRQGEDKVVYLLAQPRLTCGVAGERGGEVIGATLLLMDVTRERQLEADLQRAQRLELVGRLASGIAHDFNNVLTAIMALVHVARSRLPGDHPVHADLEGISQASEQASNLAAQLLTFGKARQVEGSPGQGDLNRVARRTLDLLRSTLPRSIVIEEVLAEGELPVAVDDTQLQQVLMNLCLNARDAMPDGGRLVVGTARAVDMDRDWVRLSVEDTGQGMSEGVRARVFDPFFSTKEKGTGLGLAVVQQITERHGGRVSVWSEEGKGARFEVWLPAGP
jgi:signal transduction histidine kinase